MSISIQEFNAKEIIEYKKTSPLQGHLNFAEGLFKPKSGLDNNKFIGGGIYGIMLDNKLIYVGKFQGKKSNWQDGNIIVSRWIKHLGTFTMLDRRISFSKKAIDLVLRDLFSTNSSYSGPAIFKEGMQAANKVILTTDMGLTSTFSRYTIAKSLWNQDFTNSHWIERFSFLYARLTESKNTDSARFTISQAEGAIIKRLQPKANSIQSKNENSSVDITINEAIDVFINELNKCYQQENNKNKNQSLTEKYIKHNYISEELIEDALIYKNSKQQNFYEQLEDSSIPFTNFISNLIDYIEEHPFASIEYTGNKKNQYQLRVRHHINSKRGFINIITLNWQKRKNCFRIRHNLPLSTINEIGLSIQSESKSDPLRYATDIAIDNINANKELFVDITDNAINLSKQLHH